MTPQVVTTTLLSSDADGWLGSFGWLESLPGLLESLPGRSGIYSGWLESPWLAGVCFEFAAELVA